MIVMAVVMTMVMIKIRVVVMTVVNTEGIIGHCRRGKEMHVPTSGVEDGE